MISREEHEEKKKGTRYDSKLKLWIGYRVDVRSNGKRLRPLFATRAEAETYIDNVRTKKSYSAAGLKAPALKRVRIDELIAAKLATLTGRKAKEFQTRVLKYFEEITGPIPVEAITLAHLREFVRKRSQEFTNRKTLVTPATVDRELVCIAALLHNAGDLFEELENYIAPRIPHPEYAEPRRERTVTDEERASIQAALDEIAPEIGRIFEFASLTGLRNTEIMRIRAAHLDRKNRSLKVRRLKNKKPVTSYIAPLTDRMLELLSEPYESGFVFTPNGKAPATFYKRLSEACEAAGVPYGRFTEDGVIFHDQRHTFVSKLASNGVDLSTIQAFSGHSTKRMVLHYSHAGPDSRRRAMAIIEGRDETEKLRQIWEQTRAGELSFEAFLDALK